MIASYTTVGGGAVRKTIYLPDDLAAQVDDYLKFHRHETFSSLVQRVLKREVRPRDPEAILRLIGLVSEDTPRNVVPLEERQPEDQLIDQER
jgi:hypothetical protein